MTICPHCKGTGKTEAISYVDNSTITVRCRICLGRGFLRPIPMEVLKVATDQELTDLKIGIYEFLLRLNPKLEADADMTDTGRYIDQSKYILTPISEQHMAQLAHDLGATQMPTESAWDAIKRYMGVILELDDKADEEATG